MRAFVQGVNELLTVTGRLARWFRRVRSRRALAAGAGVVMAAITLAGVALLVVPERSELLIGALLGATVALTVLLRRGPAERARTTDRAVERERRRIARELHDVVGHGLVVVAMQARRLPRLAPQAGPIAESIDEAAQRTIADLRRVVGVLHGTGETTADDLRRAPRTGLFEEVAAIVAVLPTDVFEVSLATSGDPGDVPAPVRAAALRVVQEGLTNAYKHSPDRPVRLTVDAGRHLDVSVVSGDGEVIRRSRDDVVRFRRGHTAGGHGLLGLLERTRELGGHFECGDLRDGFFLRARIPVTVEAAGHPTTDGEGDSWMKSAS